ncbi:MULTISPECIES: hypothetical protein [Nostocales]|nr:MULTISPECIES: hypothetical protein [Nostocales]
MKLQTTTQEIKVVTAYHTPEEYLELEKKADYKNECFFIIAQFLNLKNIF